MRRGNTNMPLFTREHLENLRKQMESQEVFFNWGQSDDFWTFVQTLTKPENIIVENE